LPLGEVHPQRRAGILHLGAGESGEAPLADDAGDGAFPSDQGGLHGMTVRQNDAEGDQR
jgi:hypothetical protein